MHRLWWSSHSMTLFGEYRGARPPPTSARMLHRNNISTMPMPPPAPPAFVASNRRRNVSLNGSQLYIRNPASVPHAKHPWSWLKFRKSRDSRRPEGDIVRSAGRKIVEFLGVSSARGKAKNIQLLVSGDVSPAQRRTRHVIERLGSFLATAKTSSERRYRQARSSGRHSARTSHERTHNGRHDHLRLRGSPHGAHRPPRVRTHPPSLHRAPRRSHESVDSDGIWVRPHTLARAPPTRGSPRARVSDRPRPACILSPSIPTVSPVLPSAPPRPRAFPRPAPLA